MKTRRQKKPLMSSLLFVSLLLGSYEAKPNSISTVLRQDLTRALGTELQDLVLEALMSIQCLLKMQPLL